MINVNRALERYKFTTLKMFLSIEIQRLFSRTIGHIQRCATSLRTPPSLCECENVIASHSNWWDRSQGQFLPSLWPYKLANHLILLLCVFSFILPRLSMHEIPCSPWVRKLATRFFMVFRAWEVVQKPISTVSLLNTWDAKNPSPSFQIHSPRLNSHVKPEECTWVIILWLRMIQSTLV